MMHDSRRIAVVTAALIVIGLCSCVGPRKRSPELQAFIDTCRQIEPGMTEDEVDAIMQEYPINAPTGDNKIMKESGGAFYKEYDSKHGAIEGDFCLSVGFDAERRVVDWQICQCAS